MSREISKFSITDALLCVKLWKNGAAVQDVLEMEMIEGSAAELLSRMAARAEAYKMIVIAQEVGADDKVSKALKAHADSI